ncbi:F0F1 ATP synthase subunit gamma [Bacteroides sp. 214]|uniref:F0F1 ATP synthase subunit gamma n=1 Tax=Bacteroides sp. 214 TaxID=2302935 RepID=UPI0013D7A2CB|nr:F0F1 ATP synthase subunit gamma [Bacteroides sp. 214]NDW12773.1 F0F1 ATP synthase subunit gamma [Bacteroides sp. 214]
MGSLKEVKERIASIKGTRKITSAMKMVASAKLHRMQGVVEKALPYQYKMNRILVNFLSGENQEIHSPFTEVREVRRVAIVVFSSNTSLCGAYNANVIRSFQLKIEEYAHLGKGNIDVYPVGKKIQEVVVKNGIEPKGNYIELAEKPTYEDVAKLATLLMEEFQNEKIDRVEIIYHHFKNMMVQDLMCEQLLPIDLNEIKETAINDVNNNEKETSRYQFDYIIEPSPEEFIANLLPAVIKQKLYTTAVDSSTSEHGARSMAMQVATDNANDLIQELTVQYNKSRQQAITNELLDIVAGSMK